MQSFTIKELTLEMSQSISKQFTPEDVIAFANITGDKNPVHLDEDYAATTIFKKRIVHGMLVASLFSTIFGTMLPGLGTIYTHQSVKFVKPVYLYDTIQATVTIKDLLFEKNRVVFLCEAHNQHGELVITGEAILMPPKGETK